jgi:hypothetical protein
MAARRPAIYGPELWTERHGQVWSPWDRLRRHSVA